MTNTKLSAIVKKYSTHPEFLGIEIVDVNQPGAVDDTLLHLVIVDGSLADVDILLECGANVNAVGDLGNTPLHIAALMCELPCAEALLSHGADLKMVNEFNEMAMDVAEIMDCQSMVALLKKRAIHTLKPITTMTINTPNVDDRIACADLSKERWTEYRDMKKGSY